MINNFYNIKESKKVIDLNEDGIINIIELNKSDYDLDLIINVNEKANCLINLISMNNESFKKIINVTINLKSNNSNVILKSNSLMTNKSNTLIKLLATSDLINCNSFVDIQINGILDSLDSSFAGLPMFKFKTNNINAKHSLNIGSINQNELNYLLSKGLELNMAKYLLISSKLFYCLEDLNEKDKKQYQNKILEMWGTSNVEY